MLKNLRRKQKNKRPKRKSFDDTGVVLSIARVEIKIRKTNHEER